MRPFPRMETSDDKHNRLLSSKSKGGLSKRSGSQLSLLKVSHSIILFLSSCTKCKTDDVYLNRYLGSPNISNSEVGCRGEIRRRRTADTPARSPGTRQETGLQRRERLTDREWYAVADQISLREQHEHFLKLQRWAQKWRRQCRIREDTEQGSRSQ